MLQSNPIQLKKKETYLKSKSFLLLTSIVIGSLSFPQNSIAASFSARAGATLIYSGSGEPFTAIKAPILPKCTKSSSGIASADCNDFLEPPSISTAFLLSQGQVLGSASPDGASNAEAKGRSSRYDIDFQVVTNNTFRLLYDANISATASSAPARMESANASYTIFLNTVYQGTDDQGNTVQETINPIGPNTVHPLTSTVDAPENDSSSFADGSVDFTINPTRLGDNDVELTFAYLIMGIDVSGQAQAGNVSIPETSSNLGIFSLGLLGVFAISKKRKK